MNRRLLLTALVGAPALTLLTRLPAAPRPDTMADIDKLRDSWRDFARAGLDIPSSDESLTLSKDEWRERLDKMQFQVLRNEGTERAFTSPLNDEKRAGLFVCAGCDLPLFTSAMKYDSGTGWPSFFTTIPGVFETKTDFKLILPRTEYHCVRCGGHHGHVFNDGPEPTNERWCNNGVALKFVPLDSGAAQ